MEIWDLWDALNQIWDRIWDLWEIYDQWAACYGNKLLLTLQYENDKFSILGYIFMKLIQQSKVYCLGIHLVYRFRS